MPCKECEGTRCTVCLNPSHEALGFGFIAAVIILTTLSLMGIACALSPECYAPLLP